MDVKRRVEILVLSDIHLGTYGCKAKELIFYLKGLDIGTLILNGDIIDMWQFRKQYWPKEHMKIIQYFMKLISKGTPVIYITGNHDEMLRRFEGMRIGSLSIVNKLVMNLDGENNWLFHGDVFDVTMKHSRWLAKLGGWGYDMLIRLNSAVNFISVKMLGKGRISLSKKIKNSVKSAISFIDDFEQTAAKIANDKGFDRVICGHIHTPVIKDILVRGRKVVYMNSGDWVENQSSLEYQDGEWKLHILTEYEESPIEEVMPSTKELYEDLLHHFQFSN